MLIFLGDALIETNDYESIRVVPSQDGEGQTVVLTPKIGDIIAIHETEVAEAFRFTMTILPSVVDVMAYWKDKDQILNTRERVRKQTLEAQEWQLANDEALLASNKELARVGAPAERAEPKPSAAPPTTGQTNKPISIIGGKQSMKNV